MCEYSDAIKLPKSYSPPPPSSTLGGQGLRINSFLAGKRGKYRGKKEVAATVLIKYVRGNLKNVTIDLAIHSHSAPIFRLRCISNARKNLTFT
jgi:hypothetical protein